MAPRPPASLVRYLREGRCVLFAGSGLSAWGKLPIWSSLLQHMIEGVRAEQPDSPDLEELDRLLGAGKLLEVADHCRETLGKWRYEQILQDRLRGDTGEIPKPHQVVVQLPFAAVVTTNYDKLLERAYAGMAGTIPRVPTHEDVDQLSRVLFDRAFFILKAHGDIGKPDSWIFTASDYHKMIHSSPAFSAVFSALLLTNAVLFVGYSLNDPDFRLLLDRQLVTFEGRVPPRYALMSGVGRVERKILSRTAGIEVLSYAEGQHEEVLAFLRALKEEVEKKPPPERLAPPPRVVQLPTAEIKRPSPIASTVLSIRMRGRVVESAVETDERSIIAQGAERLVDASHLTGLLRSALREADRAAAVEESRKVGQALAQLLPEQVSRALQEVPSSHVIVLHVTTEIESLPWEWVYIGDDYLFIHNPVVRAPIGISDQARGYPTVQQPVRVLLIGDPTDDLPGTREEIEHIAALYGSASDAACKILIGAEADFDTVVEELLITGNYDVVHFAGHAWFDDLGAFLMLHDRVALRANELRSLLGPRPPAILVLNSHFTSFVPPGVRPPFVRIDEERPPVPGVEGIALGPTLGGVTGFTEVASTTGVGAFIGSIGSPADPMAGEIGVNLHKELLKGTPVAVALHKAQLLNRVKRGYDPTWLLYTVSGYPELTLK